MKKRCDWATGDALYIQYHDNEWGVPLHDDQRLFEFVILEGVQAGLSWLTILRKRKNYRRALDGFDVEKIAQYDANKIQKLLKDPGIVRNRLKLEAIVANAKAFLEVQRQFGSFDKYVWQFVNGKPIRNQWKTVTEIPSRSGVSDILSKDLKRRGFKFVGTTICYAFMQAVGMINDHIMDCFRYREIG